MGRMGTPAMAKRRGQRLVRVDHRVDVRPRLQDGRVDHGLPGRDLEVDHGLLVAGLGPVGLAVLLVVVDVHFHDVLALDGAQRRQYRLDQQPVGAGNPGADVAVVVGKALVEEHARSQGHGLLELPELARAGSAFLRFGHGGSSSVTPNRAPRRDSSLIRMNGKAEHFFSGNGNGRKARQNSGFHSTGDLVNPAGSARGLTLGGC